MFGSIWSKSLRDYCVPILSWGIGLGLLMYVGFATATTPVLAAFASIVPLVGFLGEPVAMQTPAGYITFRYMETILPLLISFWTILAGVRLVRGEEERGTMDVLLATPQTRTRLILEKIGALVLALLLIAGLIALGVVVGESVIEQHADVVRAGLTGLNLSLFAFFFAMVGLLLSQFTTSRGAAAGCASGLLLLVLLLSIIGRLVKDSWLQYLSPLYYYNLNRPLIPSFSNAPLASLVLIVPALLLAASSVVIFVGRDIGRAAFVWQRNHANGNQQALRSMSQAWRALSTRAVSLRTLATSGWSSFWWLLGIVALCAGILYITPSFAKSFHDAVQQTPWLAQLFFDTPTDTNTGVLGAILFTFLPALVVVFALILALKWSSDLENGRLELIFSTPQARLRVLLERFGANVLVVLLAPILVWLVLISGAQLINLNINQGRVLAASFSMLPLALITMGLVYALAGRLRYGAVLGVVAAYLALSYLEETLEGLVPMPTWIGQISIFHLYGNPIFGVTDWGNILGMTGVAVFLLVISLLQFRSADITLG